MTASNFLYATGTNGFTTAPFNLQTTELNTLGSGSVVLSSVNGAGSNGEFSQTDSGSAVFGAIWFVSGGSFTPSGVGVLSGWFIISPDGGTTFEKAAAAPNRNPDFLIPFLASAYAANDVVYAQGIVSRLWAPTCKILIQNNTGASLPGSGNKILCGPIAISH